MTAADLVTLVRAAIAAGNVVEIHVPFYRGFEAISEIDVLYDDWIEFRHGGLDVSLCVPLSKIDGIRVGNNS